MPSIRYNITTGDLPITVNLKQGVSTIDSNVHTIYETGQFDNQLVGDYTLEMIDANGCVDTREFNQGGCGYGLLYNWYAATDVRNIAPAGWHVPTIYEFQTLADAIGANGIYDGANTIGGKLKEIGFTYWNSPNTDATNEVYFNARGTGSRSTNGIYSSLKHTGSFWTTTDFFGYGVRAGLFSDDNSFQCSLDGLNKYLGYSLRLLKDNQIDTGTMVGNDGKVYPTVTIGTQVWLAQNLMETRYRDGSLIPEVTDNAGWAALTTGALCAHNNDWNYACLCGYPATTTTTTTI